MARDPDSGSGRIRPPHRDWANTPTRPGPHVQPADPLLESGDSFPAEVTPIDVIDVIGTRLARVEDAVIRLELHREQTRALPETEAWRALQDRLASVEDAIGDAAPSIGDVEALKEWRLRLTGVADGNGRFGALVRRVDEIESRASEYRTDKRRIIATLAAAAIALGGGIWSIKAAYEAAAEARGGDREWRRGVDRDLERLFELRNLQRTTPDDPARNR